MQEQTPHTPPSAKASRRPANAPPGHLTGEQALGAVWRFETAVWALMHAEAGQGRRRNAEARMRRAYREVFGGLVGRPPTRAELAAMEQGPRAKPAVP